MRFQSTTEAIATATCWQDAVDNLVEFLIYQEACFSSGEITAMIRETRPDLKFRHMWVGERLRNSYYMGTFPAHPSGLLLQRGVRQTSGQDIRTPAGQEVFVYGPDQDAIMRHPFEVNIPNMAPDPSVPSDVAQATPPALKECVLCKVHADGRICIPKRAFEIMAANTGAPIVGGEPLYATWTATTIVINRTHGPATIIPTKDKCRVHLTPPSPLPLGSEYAIVIEVGGPEMTIDFADPVSP
jgi:hypothetical protein